MPHLSPPPPPAAAADGHPLEKPAQLAAALLAPQEEVSAESLDKTNWIYYTLIGAASLISLILLIVIYDLCCRCRESRARQIADGGPPATPTHQHLYRITIRADEASSGFDTRGSVLKLELLDAQNRYITSLAVPCFLLAFKQRPAGGQSSESLSRARSVSGSKRPCYQQQQQQQQYGQASRASQASSSSAASGSTQPATGSGSGAAARLEAPKSLTLLHEAWPATARRSVVSFQLIRREQLKNLSSVRISHDCYGPNNFITLRYLIVHDEEGPYLGRAKLRQHKIRAVHPCPPSGLQVYPVERLSDLRQLEEANSYANLLRRSDNSWCCQLALI